MTLLSKMNLVLPLALNINPVAYICIVSASSLHRLVTVYLSSVYRLVTVYSSSVYRLVIVYLRLVTVCLRLINTFNLKRSIFLLEIPRIRGQPEIFYNLLMPGIEN